MTKSILIVALRFSVSLRNNLTKSEIYRSKMAVGIDVGVQDVRFDNDDLS